MFKKRENVSQRARNPKMFPGQGEVRTLPFFRAAALPYLTMHASTTRVSPCMTTRATGTSTMRTPRALRALIRALTRRCRAAAPRIGDARIQRGRNTNAMSTSGGRFERPPRILLTLPVCFTANSEMPRPRWPRHRWPRRGAPLG